MKKKPLFYSFFIALTLLIALPTIIITATINYQVLRYSENEISRSAIGKLKAAENFCEMIAQNLYLDALRLTIDGTVNDISDIQLFDDIFNSSEGIMLIFDLHNALIDLAGANDILHSVYLLPDNADFIFTSNQGVISLTDFYDIAWMKDLKKFREYESAPSWMPTRTVVYSSDHVEEMGPSNKVITFFYTFTPYTTTVKGALIFNIYEESLRHLINEEDSQDEGFIAIVNQEGDIVSHIQSDMVGGRLTDDYFRQIQQSDQKEGYIIRHDGDERQIVTYYKSDFNEWIYLGYFPIDILSEKVDALIMKTVYICIICLLLAVVVSFFVSKRMSSPLSRLVEDIRIKKGIDIKSNVSEMAILSGVFEQMLKEEDRLFSILEKSKSNNKNAYLMNLLRGKSGLEMNSELTGIEFTHDTYLCAVIVFDQYNLFANSYTHEQREYMRTLILMLSEQMIGSLYQCAGVIYEKQKIVLVINFDISFSDGIKDHLESIFKKIQEEVSKVCDNSISIGIGSFQQFPASVGESFEKAQEALKYKLITGNNSINFWTEANESGVDYYYPFLKEKQIFNLINSGIEEKIEEAVTELVDDIKNHEGMHYENFVQVFNQLAVNIVRFLLDQHLNISMIFGSNYNIYHVLSTKETLEDTKDWLVELYSTITAYLVRTRNQDKSNFDRVMEYIQKNYKKDIDINNIADYVGLSYSHLRKIFKDETGDNIISYINNMRINESKRLLYQTNLTIREIALNLGYNNEQSFVRFFKKYERISPGEFRLTKKYLPHDDVRHQSVKI